MMELYEKMMLKTAIAEPDLLGEEIPGYQLEFEEQGSILTRIALWSAGELLWEAKADFKNELTQASQLFGAGIFEGANIQTKLGRLASLDSGLKIVRYQKDRVGPVRYYYFDEPKPVSLVSGLEFVEDILEVDFNAKFVLSGQFCSISRHGATQAIVARHGQVVAAVSKTVGYIVVGSQESPGWKYRKYGTKIAKALELNASGAKIGFINEKQLVQLVNWSKPGTR